MNKLDFIYSAIEKTKKRSLIIGIIFTIFGIGLIVLALLLKEKIFSSIVETLIYGLASILLLIGVICIIKFYQLRDIEGSEIYTLLMHSPQKITELQGQSYQSGKSKSTRTVNAFILVDKKTIGALTVSQVEFDSLKQYLLKHNPQLVCKLT